MKDQDLEVKIEQLNLDMGEMTYTNALHLQQQINIELFRRYKELSKKYQLIIDAIKDMT